MTALERLAGFTSALSVRDVPGRSAENVRLHLLDTLAATLAGAHTAEGRAIADLAGELRGGCHAAPASPATVPPADVPVPFAALLGSATTRSTEIDDIHIESGTTPGSVVVPTAIAVARAASAAKRPLAEDDFLAGVLAGYEVMARCGRAADGPAAVYRGVWPTLFGAAVTASAVTARLLGLGAEATAHALASALASTVGTSLRVPGLSFRWLSLGCAVQLGVVAAFAARRGFRGDLSLLDGAWNRNSAIRVETAALQDGLGASLEIDRTSIKPYCAAKQTISAVHGFAEILDGERLDPSIIDEVSVQVPPLYVEMIDRRGVPADRLSTITSLRYQFALTAYHRDELCDVARRVVHGDAQVRALMGKVTVEGYDDLLQHYPQAWPARVAVRAGGRHFVKEVLHAPGDPERRFDWPDATKKVRVLLGAPAADRLLGACRALGRGATLGELLPAARLDADGLARSPDA